ncbi:MAG: exodeoxyribonuclease III [Candidatus Nomurabacteria bacterium]|jgi:exodeoxyribonuclease-3|nr:exodeoxyribonuclease III [Candidatus Nomurabacteria bacterium]
MQIFSWNVNGLRAVIRKGEFAKFIKKYQPDILCIQETKAKRGQVEIDLPDYEEFWNSAERPGYSGTAIFVKKFLSDLRPQNVLYDFPTRLADRYYLYDDEFGDPNREGRILTIELANLFIVSVYTPNSKDDLGRLNLRANQWDPAFRDYISELNCRKPVVFCGDLNVAHEPIDLARPNQNKGKHGYTTEERMGFSAFLDAGFFDTFRTLHPDKKDVYTWWSPIARSRERNVGWRIDYFLASTKLKKHISAAEIHADQMGSDHCPISLSIGE